MPAPPVYVAPAPAGLSPVPAFDYALWSTRVFGYLIDMLFVGAVMAVLYVAAGTVFAGFAGVGSLAHPGALSGLLEGAGGTYCCCMLSLFPITTLAVGLYNKVYLVAQRGSSIGQGVLKIKVVDANGNLLTQGTALVRLLAHIGLGFLPLGTFIDLLWPLWDARRQTLHDKAVGCYVVNSRASA